MEILNKALVVVFSIIASGAFAQTPVQHQDQEVLRRSVEQFLHTQSAGLPGEVTIKVGRLDSRLNLAACAALQPFLPPGSRVWGKTTVGVRCTAPVAWVVYVPATVRVMADYVATAIPLAQGQSISAADVMLLKGDLATLPTGVITDLSQAIGRTISTSLPPGVPLRQDALRNQQSVQQGQTVRLISTGHGFQVSAEARALNNANEGQVVQARTAGGQIISGIARAGGILEVSH